MKMIASLCVAVTLLAGPVAAQSAAAAPSAPAEAAPSARQLELANELVEAQNVRKMYETSIVPMMSKVMSAAAVDSSSPDSQKEAAATKAALTDFMNQIIPKLLASSADIYARTYSEAELEQIVAFYKGPAGQAMLNKMPEVMNRMAQVMIPMIPQMKKDFVNDLCDRLACAPAKREAMLAATQQ